VDLNKEREKIIKKIGGLFDAVKGSIYEMKRYCGKSNCYCKKNKTPHKSLFLSFNYNGKTKLIPINKNQVPKIKKQIDKNKELKRLINELTRINSELLRGEKDES